MKKRYIELHLHLDGAITPDIAKDLAALQKIKLPYKDERELEKALMVSKDCRSLNEFLECFKLPCSLLQTKEGIARAVYLVQENIKRQGVVYAEIRFAPQLHMDKGLTMREVIESALDGLKKSDLKCNLNPARIAAGEQTLALLREKYEVQGMLTYFDERERA